ncbi:hypothetical protein GX51_06016 [Blastomyces parvus]|uniref:CENP-V/GFA domain-containing protein n=1 Tax=Blastomyces parvus TaxID=2060905 RepID=A0A2B7WTY4_9EURO|nr:hypothetical protein GX51_06016 [Blastomyces parvus]
MATETETSTTPPSSKKLYTGSCHCAFVKYTVNVDITQPPASRCNCSICLKKGSISLRPEKREDITLLSPTTIDELTEYTYGAKRAHHYFCPTCGVSCFIFGSFQQPGGGADVQFWAVNGLTIDTDQGLDWSTIRLQYWDGRSEGWEKGARSEPYPHGSW